MKMLGDDGKCVDKWAGGRDCVYAANATGDEKYRLRKLKKLR